MAQILGRNQMAVWRGAMVVMALATLGGCGRQAGIDDAQQAVVTFHQRLNRSDYGSIWGSTGQAFRDVTHEDQFDRLLNAVHTRLGAVKSSEDSGWRVNYTNNGVFKLIDRRTSFEKGKGEESFVFQVKDEGLQLVGYHINSMQLLGG
jgi:hypothetical protein